MDMNRHVESDLLLFSVRLLATADIYSSQFEEEKSVSDCRKMEIPGMEDCEIGSNSSGYGILLWDFISSLRPWGKAILNSGLLFNYKPQAPNDPLWGKPESEKWSRCFRNQRPSVQEKLSPHEGSEEKQPHFSYLP